MIFSEKYEKSKRLKMGKISIDWNKVVKLIVCQRLRDSVVTLLGNENNAPQWINRESLSEFPYPAEIIALSPQLEGS